MGDSSVHRGHARERRGGAFGRQSGHPVPVAALSGGGSRSASAYRRSRGSWQSAALDGGLTDWGMG